MLSSNKKLEFLSLLIAHDGGFRCFYCKGELEPDNYVYDHLNDNRHDNRIENLVLSCQSCNIKKISSFDIKILAKEKLKENEDKNFVGEKIRLPDTSPHQVSTEIEINVSNYQITEQYLTERINTDGSLPYNEALNSAAFLCKTKTGHGSQQSIRNYIDLLTSEAGPFQVVRDDNKKKIIVKRAR
jgi:hypothetical protein